MNLTLIELNTLHYVMSKAVTDAKEDYKQFGGDYFKRNIKVTEELQTKISDALYERVKEIEKIEDEWRDRRNRSKGFMTTEELDRLAQAEIDMVNKWG